MQQLMEESIENTIADRIQQLYHTQLGKSPDQLTCQMLGNKIMIWIEGGLTQPELMLLNQGQIALAQQFRDCLNQILHPQMQAVIEQVSQNTVEDWLTAVHLETNRISLIAVFASHQRESWMIQSNSQNSA